MFTIALDEVGDFEQFNKNNTPIFIAGIIYDDKNDDSDRNNERNRIDTYYRLVVNKIGGHYPEDLHVNRYKSNIKYVAMVKEEINNTIKEFMRWGKYQGEYVNGNQPRKGTYTFFMSLKSNQGKTNLLKDNTSNLIRENFASNLYTHMAEDLVSRLVFHNPYNEKIKKVHFDLPTRSVPIADDNPHLEEYKQLGYKKIKFSDGKEPTVPLYQIANDNTYRSALVREMLTTGKFDIDIDKFGVRSINYQNSNNAKRMVFLYLADSICSYLDRKKVGESQEELMESFYNLAHDLNGSNQNIFFAYDGIDTEFCKAWKKMEEGDYFESLSILYDTKKINSCFKKFYENKWFPLLENKLCEGRGFSVLKMAITKFSDYSFSNVVKQDKMYYLFEKMLKLIDNASEPSYRVNSLKFSLYETGVSAFNHLGKTEQAEECFNMCKQYSSNVGVEDYLRLRNKMTVILKDRFQYKDALMLADESVLYEEELFKLKEMVYGTDDCNKSLSYGKALSQRGQIYASLRDDRAEEDFINALKCFDNGSPNYMITMSYLLHHLIDMKQKDKYEKFAIEYFGGTLDLEKQMEYVFKEGLNENPIINLKYAFYVYIKAIYIFYIDNIKSGLRNDLINIDNTFKKNRAGDFINGDPWENIYKYCAFIAYKNGRNSEADSLMDKAANIVDNGGEILRSIVIYGKYQYAMLTNNNQKMKDIKDIMDKIEMKNIKLDKNDILRELKSKMVYMYV